MGCNLGRSLNLLAIPSDVTKNSKESFKISKESLNNVTVILWIMQQLFRILKNWLEIFGRINKDLNNANVVQVRQNGESTSGQPRVTNVHALDRRSEERSISKLAALRQDSRYPGQNRRIFAHPFQLHPFPSNPDQVQAFVLHLEEQESSTPALFRFQRSYPRRRSPRSAGFSCCCWGRRLSWFWFRVHQPLRRRSRTATVQCRSQRSWKLNGS